MRRHRKGHTGQSGLTLIETIVTIAVLGIGIVGIAASFSATQTQATRVATSARLATAVRDNTDALRSAATPYTACGKVSDYSAYLQQPTWGSVIIAPPILYESVPTGTNNAGPLQDCGGAQQDWGVQELRITATDSATGQTLSRIVLKMWNG